MQNAFDGECGAAEPQHDWLRRLPAGFYRGYTSVHWQMTIEDRAEGWLGHSFHAGFRELLLHTFARYRIICPVYCLMPDHMHLLWLGVCESADQLVAAKFFREHLNPLLSAGNDGVQLQRQAYDHVLRQDESGPDAVRQTACYIQQNPVRAKLVSEPAQWPFMGAMVPGYPTLHPLDADYWDLFWRLRRKAVEQWRPEDSE